jgi:hypothetical protein
MKSKDKALRTLGQVVGREYILQLKEDKEPTAEKLFNGIDNTNLTALHDAGATDEEIMFVIQEATKQASIVGELDTTKASKILKANLKIMKHMPDTIKGKAKAQIVTDLEVAVGKEYKNALPKELGVDDLLKIQKDKWVIRGGGDMMAMYAGVGITEQEVRDAIQGTIDYWKDKKEQPSETVG